MGTRTSPIGGDGYIRSVGWLKWLFVTKEGTVVIVQAPNVPLWLGFAADLVSYFSHGQVRLVSTWIANISFVIWAILEIGWGVNPFRRILGLVVLVLVSFATYGMIRSRSHSTSNGFVSEIRLIPADATHPLFGNPGLPYPLFERL